MANLVKIAELLKNAPDQALMQELNNPNGAAPSYMVLSELQRRKKLRGSLMNNEPQSSVAEDLEAESAQAGQMGLGSMAQAPMQQPQMQPQQAPQGYADGGEVDYGGGYTADPSENTFWPSWEEIKKRTGYGRMLPPEQAVAQAPVVNPQVAAPVRQVQATPQAAPESGIKAVPRERGSAAPMPIKTGVADEYGQFIKDALKQSGADREQIKEAHAKYQDMLAKQADEVKNSKNSDIAMALMQAGLGIAGGTSPNALQNIAQGAQPGLQAYIGMEQARQKQAQQLAMAQGQAGIAGLEAARKATTDLGELAYRGMAGEAAQRTARAHETSAGAAMANAGANREMMSQARLAGLREKAIESLGKDQNFQFMSPTQQESAIQNRMRLLGIPMAGGAAPAPVIAGTYNPRTGKIE